jgi:hypothetical protein
MPDDPEQQYAVVPIPGPGPLRDTILASAAFTGGPLSQFLSNLDTNQFLSRAYDQLKRADSKLAGIERRDEQAQTRIISDLCNGIASMAQRLDSLTESRRARHRLDALSEATEEELKLPQDALDPDNPDLITDPDPPPNAKRDRGAYPAPSLPMNDEGDLPLRGPPPETGELAVWNPKELAHPQPPQQEPTAISLN